MSRIHLEIPDWLNAKINRSLAESQLDHRDKARLFLYAIEMQIAVPLPDEFVAYCQHAKDDIRAKQKKRYQELRS
jgi:hypothetical protein